MDICNSIEGIPVIIRFKTEGSFKQLISYVGIEGIPVIIRFKTIMELLNNSKHKNCIEGIPVIIRFKTFCNYLQIH